MRKAGEVLARAGLSDQGIVDCINDMMNSGIYFREIFLPEAEVDRNHWSVWWNE